MKTAKQFGFSGENRKMSILGKFARGEWDSFRSEESDFKINWIPNHIFAVEADEETKEKETTRGLNDEEKIPKPSEVMGAVDKTVVAFANLMTGATDV